MMVLGSFWVQAMFSSLIISVHELSSPAGLRLPRPRPKPKSKSRSRSPNRMLAAGLLRRRTLILGESEDELNDSQCNDSQTSF